MFGKSENGTVACLTSKGQSEVGKKSVKVKAIFQKNMFPNVCQSRRHFHKALFKVHIFDAWHCAATPASRSCTGTRSIPQLEQCPNRIQDSPWIFNGNSDLPWICTKSLVPFLIIVLCGKSYTTATFEFVLAIAQARINRLASKCSVDIDITRHPPSHSCSEAPAEVNHAAQTLLESTGVELEVVPSGYRPES